MKRSFVPWVGSKYSDRNNIFGCRVLVFGESIYCGYSDVFIKNCCKEKDCMFERGLYCKECAEFLTHLKESDDLDVTTSAYYKFALHFFPEMNTYEFFENIAFAEWLQVGVENSDDKRRDLYPQMDESFFQTIDELRPDVLLLWGSEIAGDSGPGAYTPQSYEVVGDSIGVYKLKNGFRVPAYFMTHPSARKSSEFFADETKKILNWIKEEN